MNELTPEEAQRLIDSLEEGKQMTVKIGGEEVTYIKPPTNLPLCQQHYFEYAGMENEYLAAAQCKHCINGRLYDTRTTELVAGQFKTKGD